MKRIIYSDCYHCMKSYEPISCQWYDQLEALSVKGLELQVTYIDEQNVHHHLVGRITTLYTKQKAEYMVINEQVHIRLDTLISVNGMQPGNYC